MAERYLVDTQILLWIFSEPHNLSKDALSIIQNTENTLLISSASFWEIAIKLSLEKIKLPFEFEELIKETLSLPIEILDVQINHILKVATLPFHHKDPLDRIIISQALVENIPLISSDRHFSSYGVNLKW